MKANKDLVKIYTGVEESVLLLKSHLEKAGIKSLYKNDFSDAWLGTAPALVTLYIEKIDFKSAEPLVQDFLNNSRQSI